MFAGVRPQYQIPNSKLPAKRKQLQSQMRDIDVDYLLVSA